MTRCATIAAVALLGSTAAGQSINVDQGNAAGGPSAGYGAAGLPGTWNVVTAGPGVPQALVNLMGAAATATITRNFAADLSFDDVGTSGDDERLLDDGIGDMGDVVATVTLAGLLPGTYQVIAYAWTPTVPGDSTLVLVNEELAPMLLAGGPWPGGLEEGVTHAITTVVVTDGTMTIGAVGGYFGASGFLNGLQLRRLSEADLNDDGMVNVEDLLDLLGAWGECPKAACGGADLDGDAAVTVSDLLNMLANWG